MRALTPSARRATRNALALRRNEVLAREGIDTRPHRESWAVSRHRRNEVLAREGIDTFQLVLFFANNLPGSNEVLDREGINKIITL